MSDTTECGRCGCKHFVQDASEVTNTLGKKGHVIRWRACRNCGKRIRTREIPESLYQKLNKKPDADT